MEILTIVLGIFALSFMIAYINITIKLNRLTKTFLEIAVASNILSENSEAFQVAEDPHKENFIKFLSDSREWAFSYIEDVQSGLKSFIEEIEPSVEYFKEYGIVVEGSPHYNDMKKISEEFDKLKRLLPEELDDRR